MAAPMAVMDRNGASIAVEPFAPNIVHVTIAQDQDLLEKQPHFGIVAQSNWGGWTHSSGAIGESCTSVGKGRYPPIMQVAGEIAVRILIHVEWQDEPADQVAL